MLCFLTAASQKMRPFLSVLVLAGCLLPGSIGAIYCTVDDDTPVFSSPDLGSRVVTLVEKNTCFNGEMEGEWLVLQDKPIYYIHGYTVNEDTESDADRNGYREYDPWYKQSVRSRCVNVEGINTCAGARSIPNNRQEKRLLMGDATWTNWVEWSACDSAACNGEGTRNRTRRCFVLNPNVQANCNGGDSIELQKCTKPCLVPCSDGFSWTLWYDCTKTCDGITTRIGMCENGTANVTISVEKKCTRDLCPVDGTWSEWGNWESCSATVNLAEGIRFRYRHCQPINRHGGADCPGRSFEIVGCKGSDWEEWGSWTNCRSRNCSKGTTLRIRFCKIQNCTGAPYEAKDCYLKDCPINGAWGAWEGWSVCDCNGFRRRNRPCDSPPPTHGGQECPDNRYEVGVCDKPSNCLVDGSWEAWEGWSVCYCNGFRQRYRKCDSPFPLNGGQNCNGKEFEVVRCNRTGNTNCPANGFWNDWSAWSTCSVSCENGTQSRNRNCTNPPPAYGGRDCGTDDSAFQNCSTSVPCPVAGGWSMWSNWSICSATCQATGLQYRNRSCDSPPPGIGGQNCTGDVEEARNCSGSGACPVAGGWSTWSNWSICSATCQATGMQFRNRSCDTPPPDNGGQNCTGEVGDIRNCNGTGPCPVDGGYSNWLQWSDCSATCEGGVRYRSRDCIEPRPQNGGSNCSDLGKSSEAQTCNIQPCPVDGNWGIWSNWSRCDVTCGNGKRTRNRPCEGIAYGGQNCSGDVLQYETCREVVCPVDGAWGQWAEWNVCNCNNTQTRVRKCDSPAPVGSGQQCLGSPWDTKVCADKPTACPVDGKWGSWYPWNECSATCGPGEMSRLRLCNNPRPLNLGLYCDVHEKGEEELKGCQGPPCPISGSWSDWSAWAKCSVTCGIGSHSRNRSCDNPAPAYGGVDCADNDNETQSCINKPCPIDGSWSGWSAWTACDVTCATGTRHRDRTCDSPAPEHGGQSCNEAADQYEKCQEKPCPIDGMWSSWLSWTSCSVTCLNGARSRNRLCDSPAPQHGGSYCTGQHNGTETCTPRDNCDVDGGWTEWGSWSLCDVTCATGHHIRYRLCENPTPENFGKYCEGPENELAECFDKPCPIDGGFGAWMAWGSCFPSTGYGLKTRSRVCDNPQPHNGGRNCQGNYAEQLQCCERECPADGDWSDWSTWSDCPADSFVNTNKSRTRTCSMPTPQFGGANCTGESVDTDCCPVNGGFGAWTVWAVCSGNCIGAHRERVRQCNNPRPSCGGRYCGSGKEVDHTCIPDHCTTTTTTTTTTASPPAGSPAIIASNMTETITTKTTIASTSGLIPAVPSAASVTTTTATELSTSTTQVTADQITCTFDAPLNCTWHNVYLLDNMNWIAFNGSTNTDETGPSSDHTFGNSTGRYIYLESSAPSNECDKAWYQSDIIQPGFNAPACVKFWYHMYGVDIGSLNIYMATGSQLPGKLLWTVSGNQGDVWKSGHVPLSYTSNISIIAEATVGNGFHGDIGLDDLLFTKSTCSLYPIMANTQSAATCPNKTISSGNWSSWFNGQCSVTCGNGTLKRMRHCSTGHTEDCAGTSSEVIGCQKPPCGAWSAWFNGQCSVTCGNGTLARVRHCSTGHSEDCVGNSREVIYCQKTPCKVDGVWSSWSLWSQCDVTCEDGYIYRTRMCSNPAPAFGGLNCSGASQEANTCRLARCPDWSPWFNGKCSVTCGNGTETRVRYCSTGHKEDCAGNSSEVVGCQMATCEVNGFWSSWSTWSQCDVTCEDGHRQRTRTCTNPAPAFGGMNCSGESLETSACRLATCPSWSEWFLGDCSVTCGDGTLSRMRLCSSGHDEDCPGSAFDTVYCSPGPC